jgi:hypothetical protein
MIMPLMGAPIQGMFQQPTGSGMMGGQGGRPNWGNWAQGGGQVPMSNPLQGPAPQGPGSLPQQPIADPMQGPAPQGPGSLPGQANNPGAGQAPGQQSPFSGMQGQFGQPQQGMQGLMSMLMQHPAIQNLIQQHMQGQTGLGMGGGLGSLIGGGSGTDPTNAMQAMLGRNGPSQQAPTGMQNALQSLQGPGRVNTLGSMASSPPGGQTSLGPQGWPGMANPNPTQAGMPPTAWPAQSPLGMGNVNSGY